MSVSGIQGQLLEITVVGCNKLKDTEWISRQDPYVCLEYASTKFRTRTCTDGGKNPTFQEKFVFTLIEGLRECSAIVWNSNTLTYDDFIGSGKIQLQKVLSEGYDDTTWPLQDKRGRHAGEVRLIMHYANAKKPGKPHAPSAPSYPSAPSVSPYSAPPPVASYPLASYPPTSYPPTNYPPAPQYPSYPPNSAGYPPPPQYHQPAAAAYPPTYPPISTYPPHSAYPPPPPDPHYYPPGAYPPPPYPPPPF
ncbi:Calcium-dependent lipid-binding family protein [Perilla frutescens var. hirtella]|nr:Calcium-dependent lipid-binding family protein [Perilla frutescens var. frutescens]KAH6794011.1 Calcium-dependent lipid-binding family protein [Perilla frutescens var. hirtella]